MSEVAVPQEITIAQLDALVKEIDDQRAVCESHEDALKQENKKLASLEAKAVEYLEALNRPNYQSPHGTIGIKENWRVNLPDTPEAWGELYNYFRGRDIFEQMITVNSNKLNSFYKEEERIAMEEGRAMEFSIPGLKPAKLYKSMTFRKGRSI